MRLIPSAGSVRWRVLLGACLVLPLAAASLAAQQQRPQGSGRDIHAIIEPERTTYHVGDSIRVRVSLTNVSNDTIAFAPLPPPSQVKLVVTRNGQVVQRRWAGGGGGTGGAASTYLTPKQTAVQLWDGRPWLRLDGWGYDLKEPGTYTIVGVPQIGGPEVTADGETVRSNRTIIIILP